MAKPNIKDEETKFAFTLKTIVISILSIISVCCTGGYAVGYCKKTIESELAILRLNQEHQAEIALIKEKENQLRLEVASLKNNSVENFSSIIKLIKNNDEKDN
jgi:uncharacterized membrane protein YraQ (UPF0718 family)